MADKLWVVEFKPGNDPYRYTAFVDKRAAEDFAVPIGYPPVLYLPIEQVRTVLKKAEQAISRLLLWPVLHEQVHPEWNGNRFDDQQLGRSVVEVIASILKSDDYPQPDVERTRTALKAALDVINECRQEGVSSDVYGHLCEAMALIEPLVEE